MMVETFLSDADSRRVTVALGALSACGVRGALTGGLAVQAQLASRGLLNESRRLNDVDLVVKGLGVVPPPVAEAFLVHHAHPRATDGRLVLQLVDREQALRIDLFVEAGATLARADMDSGIPGITVVSVEDLVARTTRSVLDCLRNSIPFDPKHMNTLERLHGLGDRAILEAAWHDHRCEAETFVEAAQLVRHLLKLRPDLLVADRYSSEAPKCPRCDDANGPFRLARPELILQTLGYL